MARVKFTNLSVRRPDFEDIERIGKKSGILPGTAHFEDYCDASFVPPGATIDPFPYEDLLSIRQGRDRGVIK